MKVELWHLFSTHTNPNLFWKKKSNYVYVELSENDLYCVWRTRTGWEHSEVCVCFLLTWAPYEHNEKVNTWPIFRAMGKICKFCANFSQRSDWQVSPQCCSQMHVPGGMLNNSSPLWGVCVLGVGGWVSKDQFWVVCKWQIRFLQEHHRLFTAPRKLAFLQLFKVLTLGTEFFNCTGCFGQCNRFPTKCIVSFLRLLKWKIYWVQIFQMVVKVQCSKDL